MTEYHLRSATGRTVFTFTDIASAKRQVQCNRLSGVNNRLFKVVTTESEIEVEDGGLTPLESYLEQHA